MVANTRVKTPTAAAQLLVDNLAHTDSLIDNLRQRIVQSVQYRMQSESLRLKALSERIPVLFSLVSVRERGHVDSISQRIISAIQRRIDMEKNKVNAVESMIKDGTLRRMTVENHRLEILSQRIEAENPQRLLRRGYSITTFEGRAVRDASQLTKGATVETRVERGSFKSTVE